MPKHKKPGASKGSEKKEHDFLESYDAHADAIFRYCFFKVSDYDQAKDLTQETFMKAWQELAGGKEIDNHKAYLYRVATNLVIDYYRKKKSGSLDALREEGFDPPERRGENASEDNAELRIVREHLDRLDEKYRDVVILRYLHELSPREIAEALVLSENTVSVRIHRGLKQLQGQMDGNS